MNRGNPRREHENNTNQPVDSSMEVDEVPPACCAEGGEGMRFLKPIPAKDNSSGGGQLGAGLRGLNEGDKFNIKTKNIPEEQLRNIKGK